jgi:Autotransporter beta-domain
MTRTFHGIISTGSNLKQRRASISHTLLFSTAIVSGLALGGGAASADSIPNVCNDVNSNETVCADGTTAGDLYYGHDSGLYEGGSFTLTLDNYHLTSGSALVVDEIGVDGPAPIDGFATIEIINGSDISTSNEFGALAFGKYGAEVFSTGNVSARNGIIAASINGDVTVITGAAKTTGIEVGIGAYVQDKGNASVTTGSGMVEATGSKNDGNAIEVRVGDFEKASIDLTTGGIATVLTGGDVKGYISGINVESASGNIDVTTGKGTTTTGTNGVGIETRVGVWPQMFDGVYDGEELAYGGAGDITVLANGAVNGEYGGISAETTDGNVSVTANGVVEALQGNGIYASSGIEGYFYNGYDELYDHIVSNGVNSVTVNANANVSGQGNESDGIHAWNAEGTTVVNVAAAVTVTGTVDGVHAEAGYNSSFFGSTDNLVEGALAFNAGGGGDVTVDVKGDVLGGRHGISAWSQNGKVTVTTATTSYVFGDSEHGIQAEAGFNYYNESIDEVVSGGGGDVTVTAGGEVSGNRRGINAWSNDGNVKVSTLANAMISGGNTGIQAEAGSAFIDDDSGAYISGGEGDATVDIAEGSIVTGGDTGIGVFAASGLAKVTTAKNSEITGNDDAGIDLQSGAYNFSNQFEGYYEFVVGQGVDANIAGKVTGDNDGVYARALANNINIKTQNTSNIRGLIDNGISAEIGFNGEDGPSDFSGDITIDTAGITQGRNNGIRANTNFGDISITTQAGSLTTTRSDQSEIYKSLKKPGMSGDGIHAEVMGGKIEVSNSGVTEGGDNGVYLSAGLGFIQPAVGKLSDEADEENKPTILLNNTATGVIRNTHDGLDWTAIHIEDNSSDFVQFAGPEPFFFFPFVTAEANNDGLVEGRVEISAFGGFINNGTWRTLGESYVGDSFVNTSTGNIQAGNTENENEYTSLSVSEFGFGPPLFARSFSLYQPTVLYNGGLVSLIDSASGSGNTNTDALDLYGNYSANAGVLGLNAYLDGSANSSGDHLYVAGAASGQTVVRLVNTNAGGGSLIQEGTDKGLELINVEGPTEGSSTFDLEGGVFSTGLFDYYMVAEQNTELKFARLFDTALEDPEIAPTQYVLYSRVNGGGAAQGGQGVQGANGVWTETTVPWVDRQDELRGIVSGGPQITAVSDEGINEKTATSSFWMQGLAGKVDHNGTSSFNGVTSNAGFNQNVYGLVGGVDMGTELASGGKVLFGLMGGYTNSNVAFDNHSGRMDFDGYSLGAYATVMQGGFFLDTLVKGEFLDLKHKVGAEAGKTDVSSVGVRSDAGYRMGIGTTVFEPLVSMSYVNTQVDGYSIGALTFGSSSRDDLNVAAGGRLSYTTEDVSLSLAGRVWNHVSGHSTVDVTTAGLTSSASIGEGSFDGVYGEVSTNLTAKLADNVSGYVNGSIKFDDKTTAKVVSGGVNFKF